jgi:site-specific DNA recombinase
MVRTRASTRGYLLSGLLYCGLCGRPMIGSFNNNRNHYRCTYAAEYADANRITHPRSLYLREDHVVALIDPWIGRAFSPANLRGTLHAMAETQHSDADEQRIGGR